GCTAHYVYERRYPPLVNAAKPTATAIEAAGRLVGQERVDGATPPIMGSEDFSFMLEKKSGAYIMIGNGVDSQGGCHFVHTPLYDFNDEILTLGAAYWVSLVQVELGGGASPA